ncbi:major capsid protein E [Limosilactobacillus reuteri]|uniref:Major capsid protein E n=1 Tax=Limosilactobacillus reuteri TaxID=1598 RepID=A0A3M6SA97_LIMRT|nr:major capsid protein [Limosilactobacillus reuteri]RMX24374.1 major capsid protein E [Limosilactobacillus reuteri]
MEKQIIKLDLQRFATPILDMFDQNTVLDYTRNRQYPDMLGDTLFPATKVPTLEVEILKAGSRVPTIASYSAFDAEAEIGSREASKMTAELAYVKRKMQITEEMLIKLRYPRNNAEANYLKQYVFNDIDAMVQAVKARGEKMTMEMFATGKITDKDNGISIDYQVPKEHQTALASNTTWDSGSASIIENLQDWSDKLDITPTRALTSKKVLRTLMRSTEIKEAIFGKDTGRVVGQADLDQFMVAQGLPVIRAYAGKYREEDAKGKVKTQTYFPEDRIVLFNDEVPGEKIYGPTPEENRLISTNAQVSEVGNIMAKIYESGEDPIGTWVLAAATMLPSFASADNVYQAKVL